MSIPCPGCGREYDVTLFEFGRTISCTCGRRVGREKRLTVSPRETSPGFVADAMLGKLARWLRILGYDTTYDPRADDAALVRIALTEGRRLLTRDRRIFAEWRIAGGLVLDSDEPLEQLRETARAFDLDLGTGLFTRCPICNAPLVPAAASEVIDRVPARVLEAQKAFSRCPGCERVYWQGSHTRRIRLRLGALESAAGARSVSRRARRQGPRERDAGLR